MADGTYDVGLEQLGTEDWTNLDVRVLLLEEAAHTFDRTHATVTAVLNGANNTEATGTGYQRQTLSGLSATIVSGNRLRLDHNDVEYFELDAGQLGAAIYYVEGATDGDRIPLFFKDSGFPFTSNGGDATLRTGDNGLVELADAA